jgi:hypothetical protein
MLAFLVLAAIQPAHAAPTNLLQNPGFEKSLADHSWMPAGWDTSRAGLSSVFFGRDTLSPHGGSYSVSVANASAIYPLSHNWAQAVLVGREAWGKDLVFSVWTRTLGLEGRAFIKLDAYRDTVSKMSRTWNVSREAAGRRLGIAAIDDPILNLGWKREFFSEPETDWVLRQVRVYIAPSTNVVFVRCGLIGTGQLMLDDASLTLETAKPSEVPALNTNLLLDPGFEGNGNEWEMSLPPYADMKAEVDRNVARSGQGSMLLSSPPVGMVQARAGVSQVFNERGLSGKRVKLSSYIKCDSLGTSAYLSIFCHGINGVVQNVSPQTFSGTTDWSLASVEIDVPPQTYAVWAWLNYMAPTRGYVHFDDASFTVIESPAASKP